MSKYYRTIVVDPPWPYEGKGLSGLGERKNPRSDSGLRFVGGRYPGMSLEAIGTLAIGGVVEKNAHLYLWTTNAFMYEAHEVADAWGFRVKTILTWVKTGTGQTTLPRGEVSMRSGYYFRGATEHCLFGVRGSLSLQTEEALPTAFLWPRKTGHSVKPDAFYDLVEKASPGPYLEMFSRRARLGDWDYWGDESLQTVELPNRTVNLQRVPMESIKGEK